MDPKLNTVPYHSDLARSLYQEMIQECLNLKVGAPQPAAEKFHTEVNWEYDVWQTALQPLISLMRVTSDRDFNGYFLKDFGENDLFPLINGKIREIFVFKGYPNPALSQVDYFMKTGDIKGSLALFK